MYVSLALFFFPGHTTLCGWRRV